MIKISRVEFAIENILDRRVGTWTYNIRRIRAGKALRYEI